MIRKLRWKFVGINMALVTVILAAIFAFVLQSTRSGLERDSMEALERAVALNGFRQSFSVDDDPDDDWDGPMPFLPEEKIQLPFFTVQVVGESTGYLLTNQFFDTTDPNDLVEVINLALCSEENTGEMQYGDYSMRFLKAETLFGTRIAFVDLTQEQSTLRTLLRNLIIVGVAAMAVFFAISLLLARWAVRPVEKSWKQQRQFVSDASHELKTPLAVIQSSLDMLDASPDAEPEKRARWLENVRVSSDQMKTLVEELLVLTRSDNATQQVHLDRCDLSDITTSSLLLFEPIAFEKGKLMEDEIEEGVFVTGDAAMLKRLVDIYLDNACKYAVPGDPIRVGLKGEGKRAVLSVYSPGTPIEKEQLTRIFERFYRMDASRTTEGYGLGLSIAVEIARAHHGKVWAEASAAGNTFYFSLPRER